jgi:hypothetical protein
MGKLIVGLVLAAAGVGFVFGAGSLYGTPWSFQDRSAVFLEVAGKAVLFPADPKRHDPSGSTRTFTPDPGTPFFPGDELRVSGMGFSRMRFPEGVIEMSDGARLLINDSGNLMLGRGHFKIIKNAGVIGNWVVKLGQGGTGLVIGGGSCLLHSNGSGHALVRVDEGQVSLSANRAKPLLVKPGQVAAIVPDQDPAEVEGPGELTLTAKVKKRRSVSEVSHLRGQVSHLAAIYVDGELLYPDATGNFELPLPPGKGHAQREKETVRAGARR